VYREISAWKQERKAPVVAQLMGVAASGGYYVALAADYIVAHPTTITGSIGVIAAGINLSGLMQRYGVADQTLTSGAFKDAGSPLRPMTPAERKYLQQLVDDLYARFRAVVSEGRPALSQAQVVALSDGRAFTAQQAKESGLVDAIGYFPDAIAELGRRLDAESLRVVSFHRQGEWRSNYYSTAPAPPRAQNDVAQRLGLDRGPPFLYLWWPPAGLLP
jgi:protease-4